MKQSRQQRRRARGALLCCLVAFAVVQVGMGFALDAVRPGWCDPEFAIRMRSARHFVRTQPHRSLAIAVGSSRTELGLCPGDLREPRVLVLNFSQTGAGPVRQLITVRRLLSAGIKPDLLLVEFLPRFFNQNTENVPTDKIDEMGWNDVRALDAYLPDRDGVYRSWAEHRIVCGYSCRKDILRTLLPRLDPIDMPREFYWRLTDPYGWLPPAWSVTPAERERHVARARDEYYNYLRPYAIKPIPDRALRETLTLAREHGIETVLYLMPESTGFRSWYPPETLEVIDHYLAELRNTFAIPIVDCREWIADDDFSDGHHLLIPGAQAFTRRFAREVIFPRLLTQER
jgi:hypothetical protein